MTGISSIQIIFQKNAIKKTVLAVYFIFYTAHKTDQTIQLLAIA